MKRLPAVQSHHQSNISSVSNRIIGWYIFRFTCADWVGTFIRLGNPWHL
jgi:hypothetical protein